MRTLMETIAKINEAELPHFIGHGSDNADIVYAYDDHNVYNTDRDHNRRLQEIGSPESLDTWHGVMDAALGWNDNEYNDFNADNVYQILMGFERYEHYSYTAAREYSPAMYISVTGQDAEVITKRLLPFEQFVRDNQRELRVSEIHLQPKTDHSTVPALRLWWD